MMTLEQQLFAVMDQHELNYLSLAVYTLSDGTRFFGASAHAGGTCGSDNSGPEGSLVGKLNNAIADLNAKRAAPTVTTLAPMGEAA